MNWASYLSYLAFAGLLVLVPGADFTVIVKNTLAGGRVRGRWSAAGVAGSNAVQGLAAIAGLGAVIVRFQPLFEAIKWAGIAYLAYLAVLPQFIGPHTPAVVLPVFGLTHALLSLGYLLIVVTGLDRIRGVLTRRRVRRALDAVTGTALLGFGARLASTSA